MSENRELAKRSDIITDVATRLRGSIERKELVLPRNYSEGNALKEAWLVLQETLDRDKRPVLQTCTPASITNALLNMAVQGLSPGKHQCYFIANKGHLRCHRSYFGTMMAAQEVAGASHIFAEVVYEGDEFIYEIKHNQKVITKHTQKLENIDSEKIIAAYCVIEFKGDKPDYTEIMSWEQIQKAWTHSTMNIAASDSAHRTHPEEMAKRTVINRACKKMVNSSSDSNLYLEAFNRADEEQAEDELATEIAEHANKEILDFTESEEVPEPVAVEEEPQEVYDDTPPLTTASPLATEAQIRKVWADAGRMGYQDGDVEAIVKDRYELDHLKDMSVKQASELIGVIARGEGLAKKGE